MLSTLLNTSSKYLFLLIFHQPLLFWPKQTSKTLIFFPFWELPHLNHAIPVWFMLKHAIPQHLLSILFLPNLMLITQQPLFKKKKKASQVFLKFSQSRASLCQTICIDLKNDKAYSFPSGGYMNQPGQSVLIPLGTMTGSIRTIIYKEQTIYKDR